MTRDAAARKREMARLVKRAPGYQWALTEVLPRVRRSPLLTDVAWRVFAPRHTAGHVDVPMHPGRYLSGRDVSLVPVVAVLATGLSPEQARTLVDQVADLQRRLGSFRPLLVLDLPVFELARHHGFVLEVLTPRAHFAGSEQEWTAYLAACVGSIVDGYQPWYVVRCREGLVDPLDVAVLEHLADRLPDDLQVRTSDPAGS